MAIELTGLEKQCIITERKKRNNKENDWKYKMKVRIDLIRSEISQIEQMKLENLSAKIRRNSAKVRRKYKICDEEKRKSELEKMKRLAATSTRSKRFEEREKQFRQNYDFMNDRKKLYNELRGAKIEIKENEIPSKETIQSFWKPIYETKKILQ